MICNRFRRLLRSSRRFFQGLNIMALFADLQASISALDAKVTAHLDADGAAMLVMIQKNADLQTANATLQATNDNLTAQLAVAAANSVSDEEKATVLASIDAVGNRL